MNSSFCLSTRSGGVDRDLAWVLHLAFGPTDSECPAAADTSRAVELAVRLCLAGRITSRISPSALEPALGASARNLAFERLRLIAEQAALTAVREQVNEIADKRKLRVLWLKFAALRLRGVTAPGTREARDLDLLSPEVEGRELYAALREAGFRLGSANSPAAHQLPALLASSGAAVEIHRAVWGVDPCRRGAFAANFDDFRVADVITTLANGTLVPTDPVLAAHTLVHGLVQHRSAPHDYAPFRLLADLTDLRAWNSPLSDIHGPIAARLSVRAVADACALACDLARGERLEHLPSREQRLLSSLLAASLDDDIQGALRLERLSEIWSEGGLRSLLSRGLREAPVRRGFKLARGILAYGRLRWRQSRLIP